MTKPLAPAGGFSFGRKTSVLALGARLAHRASGAGDPQIAAVFQQFTSALLSEPFQPFLVFSSAVVSGPSLRRLHTSSVQSAFR